MRIHATKSNLIIIAALTAILVIGLMATAVSADTPMNIMGNNCNYDCDVMDTQSAMPQCCSMSDSSFPDCSLADVPANEAILPGHSNLNWDIDNCQHTQSIPLGIDNSSKQFSEQELPQFSSPRLCSAYHCRNSLESEDPNLK